ncbi:peptidase C15 [Oculatella sp. LEGE 06141]|uniref:pyroglutamyl-peptidase I family protein n=1 Tax=Oculatella sp. LEGE 06141 TaxID=1828648 RepID=UPI00187E371C|nr:peptidase C15 [Oculatella sp. LEGE 06141]MBE9182303.1 peptidase C15 [Oculatella sp. LEGE 06141]
MTSLPTRTLLLTSFTVWQPHHTTNSSDDLLLEVLNTNPPSNLHFLRSLPVDFEAAPQQVIARFNELQPDGVVCCGMAETRSQLTVEARAILRNRVLYPKVNVETLVAGSRTTAVSKDAGRFVCNTLYYRMLHHLHRQYSSAQCVFVHVPVLLPDNREAIVADFRRILELMSLPNLASCSTSTVDRSLTSKV